jgi:hypothetical protein
MLATATYLHYSGLVCVFTILAAVFVALGHFTITDTMSTFVLSVISHKTSPRLFSLMLEPLDLVVKLFQSLWSTQYHCSPHPSESQYQRLVDLNWLILAINANP